MKTDVPVKRLNGRKYNCYKYKSSFGSATLIDTRDIALDVVMDHESRYAVPLG